MDFYLCVPIHHLRLHEQLFLNLPITRIPRKTLSWHFNLNLLFALKIKYKQEWRQKQELKIRDCLYHLYNPRHEAKRLIDQLIFSVTGILDLIYGNNFNLIEIAWWDLLLFWIDRILPYNDYSWFILALFHWKTFLI